MSKNEPRHLSLSMQSRPLPPEVTPTDETALRQVLMADAVATWKVTGALQPAVVLVRARTLDDIDISDLVEVGEECFLAALLVGGAGQPGVLRRVRRGEVMLRDDDGTLRRAIAILEDLGLDEDGARQWWAASCWVGTGPAQVGLVHGGWLERDGGGLDTLPEGLREWLDEGTAKIEATGARRTDAAPVHPEIRMLPLGVTADTPLAPRELGRHLAEALVPEIVTQGLPWTLILAFRGGAAERWEVRGPLDLDDMVRTVAAMSDTDAIALVVGGVVDVDGTTLRAIHIVCESPTERARTIVPLYFDGGRPEARRMLTRDESLPDDERWIGVAPSGRIELTMLGPESPWLGMGGLGEA